MAGINNLLDANGDPKSGSTIGDVTDEVTVGNKTFFDTKIFDNISAIVERLQGGSTNSRIRSTADYSDIHSAIASLPA